MAQWLNVSQYDPGLLADRGVLKGGIVYSQWLWNDINELRGFDPTVPETWIMPTKFDKIEAVINDPDRVSGSPIMLDLEHAKTGTWNISGQSPNEPMSEDSERTMLLSRDYYAQIIDFLKEKYPAERFLLYGVMPEQYGGSLSYRKQHIQRSNELFSAGPDDKQSNGLADRVDTVCVVGYLRYDTTAAESIARIGTLINDARNNWDKKVGVILWPRYHNAHPTLAGQEIPKEVMLEIFKFVDTKADIVWLWGGYLYPLSVEKINSLHKSEFYQALGWM